MDETGEARWLTYEELGVLLGCTANAARVRAHTRPDVRVIEAALDSLREQLGIANTRIDEANRRADRAEAWAADLRQRLAHLQQRLDLSESERAKMFA